MALHSCLDRGEELHVIEDKEVGFAGVIAIHSTALGPAAGGCRFWHYDTSDDLIADAKRLARGMSYKNALAGLPFGGGKAVLQRPAGSFSRADVLRVFAQAVARLDGRYVTAEDVGTSVEDMELVRERTRHVAGLRSTSGMAGGDPSPWTALGVYQSMVKAAALAFGTNLIGVRVAVQGAGNVGASLCRLLDRAGARLIIADVNRKRAENLCAELNATLADPDSIVSGDCDIFAPCALGGGLNEQSIPELKARLICGGANNQLATPAAGAELAARGITYCPDYVVNAGGIINVAAEYLGESTAQVADRVDLIASRLGQVLSVAKLSGRPPHEIADEMAEAIIASQPAAVLNI